MSVHLVVIQLAFIVLATVDGAVMRLVAFGLSLERGSNGYPGHGVRRMGPAAEVPNWKSMILIPWAHLKGSLSCRYSISSLNTLISPPLHPSQVEVMVWASCCLVGR